MLSRIFDKLFFAELLPCFYFSLTFLCKFEERFYIQSLICYLRRYFKHEAAWRYVQASVAAYVIDWMPYWAKLETNKNMYKTSLNKNFDTAIIQIRKKSLSFDVIFYGFQTESKLMKLLLVTGTRAAYIHRYILKIFCCGNMYKVYLSIGVVLCSENFVWYLTWIWNQID